MSSKDQFLLQCSSFLHLYNDVFMCSMRREKKSFQVDGIRAKWVERGKYEMDLTKPYVQYAHWVASSCSFFIEVYLLMNGIAKHSTQLRTHSHTHSHWIHVFHASLPQTNKTLHNFYFYYCRFFLFLFLIVPLLILLFMCTMWTFCCVLYVYRF